MSLTAEARSLASVVLDRFRWLKSVGLTFNGKRDLRAVLGYNEVLTNADYRDRYARGGIAKRAVKALPKATWRGGMELIEDDDPEKHTPFEVESAKLARRLKIAQKFYKADIQARLSTYSVVLIGVAGDRPLSEEMPRGSSQEQVLYATPYGGGGGPSSPSRGQARRTTTFDTDATIHELETDIRSPRFGEARTYLLRRAGINSPEFNVPVHWSRIVHVAEETLDDECYGEPTLEAVWNYLDDLAKVVGGGAEAFWLRVNQGQQWDVAKDMNLSEPAKEDLKTQADEYEHGIRRILRTKGVDITPLGSDVADFSSPVDALLTLIAGTLAIPKRILTGSEMGELASSQDRENWRDQVNGRQTDYAGPEIVEPFFDRLIKYGYLPTPGEDGYEVVWPHRQILTEDERAAGAQKWASVNRTQGSPVFTDDEIRDKWYGKAPLTDEEIAAQVEKKLAAAPPSPFGMAPGRPEPKAKPGTPGAPAAPFPRAAQSDDSDDAESERELMRVLEAAIAANNTVVVDRILGLARTA